MDGYDDPPLEILLFDVTSANMRDKSPSVPSQFHCAASIQIPFSGSTCLRKEKIFSPRYTERGICFDESSCLTNNLKTKELQFPLVKKARGSIGKAFRCWVLGPGTSTRGLSVVTATPSIQYDHASARSRLHQKRFDLTRLERDAIRRELKR
jgi:hypothetical protein